MWTILVTGTTQDLHTVHIVCYHVLSSHTAAKTLSGPIHVNVMQKPASLSKRTYYTLISKFKQ